MKPCYAASRVAAVLAASLLAVGPNAQPLPQFEFTSPNPEQSRFGIDAAGVPDVDGDGITDFLIGSDDEEGLTGLPGVGRAFVYSGADGLLLHEIHGPSGAATGFFGHTVAGISDLDGDGRGELAIGAIGEDDAGHLDAGRVYVFSGATGTLLYGLSSPHVQAAGAFGVALAEVDDLDER